MSWQRRKNSRSCTRRSLQISSTTALALSSGLYPSTWTSSLTTAVTLKRKRGNYWAASVFKTCNWFLKKCFLLIFGALFFRSEIQAGAKLSLNRQFVDERWSKHRVVTCLDWSPQVIFLSKVFMVKPTRAWLIVDFVWFTYINTRYVCSHIEIVNY